jgi:YHS domain-containing protein
MTRLLPCLIYAREPGIGPTNFITGSARRASSSRQPLKGTPMASQARDPVCGVIVDTDKRRVEYKEADYYFCSDTCRSRFKEHPEDYAKPPLI